jgi:hypothetical protein
MKLIFRESVREKLDALILEARKSGKEIEKISLKKWESDALEACFYPYVKKSAYLSTFTYMGYPVEIEND